MRLERERADGTREFWDAAVKKATVVIESGTVQGLSRTENKPYKSAANAKVALEKLVATKRRIGFGEPVALGSNVLPAKQPVNPELEKSLREDGAAAVYIDWLQAQGAPIGEYIALAAALEGKRHAKKRARLDALAKDLVMPPAQLATWGTKHGFFEWLRLENSKDWTDDEFDAVAFAKRLFATPLCAALDELRIGMLRWDHNAKDVPAVLDEAGGRRWAKSLARLHLGDIDSNIDMAHHVVGDVGGVITLAFPKLRCLKVHSGSQDWSGQGETFSLAGLALPKLETLVVETCAMTSARLDAILRAKLPALTRLELWFGATDRDAGATLANLAPLLDGKVFTSRSCQRFRAAGTMPRVHAGRRPSPRNVSDPWLKVAT